MIRLRGMAGNLLINPTSRFRQDDIVSGSDNLRHSLEISPRRFPNFSEKHKELPKRRLQIMNHKLSYNHKSNHKLATGEY